MYKAYNSLFLYATLGKKIKTNVLILLKPKRVIFVNENDPLKTIFL